MFKSFNIYSKFSTTVNSYKRNTSKLQTFESLQKYVQFQVFRSKQKCIFNKKEVLGKELNNQTDKIKITACCLSKDHLVLQRLTPVLKPKVQLASTVQTKSQESEVANESYLIMRCKTKYADKVSS